MSRSKLCELPACGRISDMLEASDSRLLWSILPMGKAAMDSLLSRRRNVCGILDIVTTECRRPWDCVVFATVCWDRVARYSASLGDTPEPSPPRSLRRRTFKSNRNNQGKVRKNRKKKRNKFLAN